MAEGLQDFERICRLAQRIGQPAPKTAVQEHPFDVRRIHPTLPAAVRQLFNDGHYKDATFNAFVFLENEVRRHAPGIERDGSGLMMSAFGGEKPTIALTALKTRTECSEQEGYKFLFAGALLAIRNPRGHESGLVDDAKLCLDHLTVVSMLLRRLELAGYT